MELGQALFGTGAVQQHEADWATDGLHMIAQIISEHRHGKKQWPSLISSNDGEPEFENDVFVMRSYYWGNCTCDHDDKVAEWENSHDHADNCYQTVLHNRCRADYPNSYDYKPGHGFKDNCIKQTCVEFGIDPDAPGGMIHCTCNHVEAWQAFMETVHHSDDCRMEKPNFVYKPTGVEMSWYKHAGRSITCNRTEPSMLRWFQVITHCISSIQEPSVSAIDGQAEFTDKGENK